MSLLQIATGRPAAQFLTLAQGTRAFVQQQKTTSIVSAVFFWPVPGAMERPHEAGLFSFLNRVLKRGTLKRSNFELAEAIDGLGIDLGTDTGDDYSFASLKTTAETFREALDLLAEVVREPALEPEEIEKERENTLALIRRADDDLMGVTTRAWFRALFGDHGYGLSRLGTASTVGEFTREQLRGLHEEFFVQPPALACVVGDCVPDDVYAHIQRLWPAVDKAASPIQLTPPAARSGVELLRRESNQSFLSAGYALPAFGSDDWSAIRVMNCVLGEGMSSRLFRILRDEQGLAYATGSATYGQRYGSALYGYIGTKPSSLIQALDGMEAQFRRMTEELVPAEELERSKNYLIGRFLIDHQTNGRQAFYPGHFEMMGVGAAWDNDYPVRISEVTAEQVRDAARRYLTGRMAVAALVPESAPEVFSEVQQRLSQPA